MHRSDDVFIRPIQPRLVTVKLIRRIVNQIKAQLRVFGTKICGKRLPPCHQLGFIFHIGIGFKGIGLVGNNGDEAVLLAGFHQFTQVDKPGFGQRIRNTNAHMANPFCIEVTRHQRVKLPDTPIGPRPVDVQTDPQLMGIARRVKWRIGSKRRGHCQEQRHS